MDYPKALYRDGGEALIWGRPVQTLIAGSAEEERQALAQGWRLHPIGEEPKRRGQPPKER